MHTHQVTDRQLRYFGLSLAALLIVFAALAHWKWHSPTAAGVLLGIAVTLLIVYYAAAATRRPIYRAFRALTYPIQLLMTAVILAIVYYGMVTPIGLILRLRGMGIRARGEVQESHWVSVEETSEPTRYFHTY